MEIIKPPAEIKIPKKYIKDYKKHNKTFYEKNKNNKKICPDCGHQYIYSVHSQHLKLKKHNEGMILKQLEKKVEELKARLI